MRMRQLPARHQAWQLTALLQHEVLEHTACGTHLIEPIEPNFAFATVVTASLSVCTGGQKNGCERARNAAPSLRRVKVQRATNGRGLHFIGKTVSVISSRFN